MVVCVLLTFVSLAIQEQQVTALGYGRADDICNRSGSNEMSSEFVFYKGRLVPKKAVEMNEKGSNKLSAEVEAILRDYRDKNPREAFEPPLQPPWLEVPSYEMYSMGWKMGSGEDYMRAFRSWFRNMESDERNEYIKKYAEPDDWKGFYQRAMKI